MNIYNILIQSADKWPDGVAVIDEFGSLTYRELLHETNCLIRDLQSGYIGPGIALGIITKNNRNFITTLMAGVGCNALVMPIFPQQKPREIEENVRDGQLHYLLTDTEAYSGMATLIKVMAFFGEQLYLYKTRRPLAKKTAAFVPDAALMRFTSGTTGKAKGVIISHKSVVERVKAANKVLKLGRSDRVVWVLPMAFHFVVSIVLYLKYGVGIIVNDNFLADSIIDSIRTHRGTLLYGSPMHIKLLNSHPGKADISSLKKVISTTTGISAELCRTFTKKYGLPVTQAFGIIEVGLPIINQEKPEEHPDAVGYALPAYQVGILDEQHLPLPDGKTGLLGIRGPGMFDGYLDPPTPREKVLKNGWFLTGDYAVRTAGGLITIKGRKKNVVNVSGNKVFPEEVQDVINTYEGITASKVYSKQHPLLGEVVAADVVLEEENIDTEAIINHCRQYLSPYKVPQFVRAVEQLDMTASGKVKV